MADDDRAADHEEQRPVAAAGSSYMLVSVHKNTFPAICSLPNGWLLFVSSVGEIIMILVGTDDGSSWRAALAWSM